MWKRKRKKRVDVLKKIGIIHYNLRVGKAILILTQYPEAQKEGLVSLIRKLKTDNKFYHDQNVMQSKDNVKQKHNICNVSLIKANLPIYKDLLKNNNLNPLTMKR